MGRADITEPLVGVLSRVPVRTLAACAGVLLLSTTATTTGSGSTTTAGATGRIEGVVRLVAPVGTPIPSGAYPSRRVSTPTPKASEIGNVVVFVKDAPYVGALAHSRAQMRQADEGFFPRLVAITRGSTVEFPNADPFFHNVFSLSRGATFDLGRYARGDSRSRTFTRPGLVKVYCHLHSQMSASIMVFDHPHFAIPQGSGQFILPDVLAGEYRISAWHERIGESAKSIVVEPGRTANIEFALPVENR